MPRDEFGLNDPPEMKGSGSKSLPYSAGVKSSSSFLREKGSSELPLEAMGVWTGSVAVRGCSFGSFGGVMSAAAVSGYEFLALGGTCRNKEGKEVRTPRITHD